MVAYYYHDPSGLGVWQVLDGQTPAQAFDALNIIPDPILSYSVANTPAAQKINGGNTNAPNNAPAPGPKGYSYVGSTITPNLPPLTTRQKAGLFKPRDIINGDDPGASLNDCGPDAYLQIIDDVPTCVPINIIPLPGGGSQGGTGTVSSQSTYVTVNNTLDLSNGVGQAIGDAVTNSVQSDLNTVNNAINDTTNTIQSTLTDITSGIGSLVDGIIQNVYKALQWLGNLLISNIDKIAGFISDNIGKIASAVTDIATKITSVVQNVIGPAITNINNIISNTIAPIFNTISDVFRQTTALITAIQQDIKGGLDGILRLPQDISNGLTGIIGDVTRAVNQIGIKKQDGTSVFIGPDGKDSVWDRLSTIGHGVSILGGTGNVQIDFDKTVNLSEPDLSQAGAAALAALGQEINSLVSDLLRGGRSSLNVLATAAALSPTVLGIEVGTWIGWWELIRSLDQMFEPFFDFAKEDLAAKAGLSKLPVGSVLEAWRRKLVTDHDLQEDLAVNGWNSGRIQVLKDLQQHLFDISTAIDLHHRGIINDSDFTLVMSRNGVTGEQQQAYLEQHLKLFDVNLASTAFKWGLVDEQALDAVLKENRYTDTEITAYKATLLQRETVEDVIQRERLTILYSGLGFSPESFATPSDDVLQAATRDGLDARTALDRWQSSFFVLPLNEWIVGYFRGIFTLRQLNAAMDYYRVPNGLRDVVVSARRALIPWRTIPTMLANGIIDEAYAKQQLSGHGFDLPAQEALLKFAAISHKKAKTAASPDVLGLSVATARSYFDMGTITPEQYKEILLAHGYDEQSATLSVQVETQHAGMLERKKLSADIVNEVIAGLLTIDQAMAQMDSNQFSAVEKSKALNSIHRNLKQSSKTPSEGELHSMAKAGAISLDLYRQGLGSNGFAQSWIDAFVKWRFPENVNTASATSVA